MDDPASDGKERVADIFIVSTDETVSVLFKEHLEQHNYQVTVFTDDAQLKETLPAGKPGLLIYDGTTGGQKGYEVIRQIKADKDLWVIPVLILTAASTMDDLLRVLESNADNFIAPPYNLPDHLSIIEGMLATPVEPQTWDGTKKQFRVRHDDQTYVVAATSRKLLEYLLSSFDVVVSKSSELSSSTSKLLELTESVKVLEQTVTGQTKEIATLNAISRQKEQKIIELTAGYEELEKNLAQKTDEIKNLAAESETRKTSLETVQHALMEEEARSASLEKTLRDLRSELEKQKSARMTENNRSMSAEQEINALKQAKTQSEHDLNQVITGLNETAQQHDAVLTRLKSEMEAETNRRVLAENQATERQREFEQYQNTSHSEIEALNQQVGKLQETLTVSAAALETGRELRRASEEKTKAAFRQQEDLVQQTRIAKEELERANKDQAVTIGEIKEELQTAGNQVRSLEADVRNLAREKALAEQDIRTLTDELEHTRTTLANERKSHLDSHEGHDGAVKERPLVQQSLFQPDEITSPKENPGMVSTEKSPLPMAITQVSQPVTREITTGLQQPIVSKKDPDPRESSGGTSRIFSGIIPQVSGISDADSIFLEHEPMAKNLDPVPGPTNVNRFAEGKTVEKYSPGKSPSLDGNTGHSAPNSSTKPEKEMVEKPENPGSEPGPGRQSGGTPDKSGGIVPGDDISFNSKQWLDLLKWAHHSDALSHDQRLKILRMGRLIQKDQKLTKKQQDLVREILSVTNALGYQSQ